MSKSPPIQHQPRHEHSVPWFWPMAAASELGEQGLHLFQDNLRNLHEAEQITAAPAPRWASANHAVLDLPTMRLRDFAPAHPVRTGPRRAVLIDAPYAGHSSTIADFAKGQSLVATLQANGLDDVLVTDWKNATARMKDFDIDRSVNKRRHRENHPFLRLVRIKSICVPLIQKAIDHAYAMVNSRDFSKDLDASCHTTAYWPTFCFRSRLLVTASCRASNIARACSLFHALLLGAARFLCSRWRCRRRHV